MSKRHPEDAKEVVVWKRFSELRKLHGELAFTHKNLFRREEEFPPFPRAQVFGITGGVLTKNTRLLLESDSALFQVPQIFHVASAYCETHFTRASCFISPVLYVIIQLLLPHQCTIATCGELQGFLSASLECTKTNRLIVAPLCHRKV